jgi:hypothetical protein
MAGVSRETAFYRAAWTLVIVALVAACAFGAVSVESVFSAHPNVAASVPKATADMVRPLVETSASSTLHSITKQVCADKQVRAKTVESNDGKIIAIHC